MRFHYTDWFIGTPIPISLCSIITFIQQIRRVLVTAQHLEVTQASFQIHFNLPNFIRFQSRDPTHCGDLKVQNCWNWTTSRETTLDDMRHPITQKRTPGIFEIKLFVQVRLLRFNKFGFFKEALDLWSNESSPEITTNHQRPCWNHLNRGLNLKDLGATAPWTATACRKASLWAELSQD